MFKYSNPGNLQVCAMMFLKTEVKVDLIHSNTSSSSSWESAWLTNIWPNYSTVNTYHNTVYAAILKGKGHRDK